MIALCVECKRFLTDPPYKCTSHPQAGVQISAWSQEHYFTEDGVCRGLVLLWIKFMIKLNHEGNLADINVMKNRNFTKLHLLSITISSDKEEILSIMDEQTQLLGNITYRWSDADTGLPFSDVHGQFGSLAKDNQQQAINARDEWIKEWARKNEFECIKTAHTFSSTQDLVNLTKLLAMQYGGVLGYLSVQGSGGHALGFGCQPGPEKSFSVAFFDPNFGEYLFRSPGDFATFDPSSAWLNRHINKEYPNLLKVMYVHFFVKY